VTLSSISPAESKAHRPASGSEALAVDWLGRVPYAAALALQDEARTARTRGECGDRLLLLEHPPVVTLGRSHRPEHLRLDRASYAERGIEVFEAARGGDVTYHAPGQLVGYLVIDLDAAGERDLHRHVRRIEAALMEAIRPFGIATRRVEGRSGVFVDRGEGAPGPDRKLASIGVGVKRWVTWHGFALNVTTDLEGFEVIVPCGLGDVEMTSVARESGRPLLGLDAQVRDAVTAAFVREFGAGDRQGAGAHGERP
jgi:lipoate-protein ligase B